MNGGYLGYKFDTEKMDAINKGYTKNMHVNTIAPIPKAHKPDFVEEENVLVQMKWDPWKAPYFLFRVFLRCFVMVNIRRL